MSIENSEQIEMATDPINEHEWLKNLIGEWRIKSEMAMEPGAPRIQSEGTASVKDLGGLWAYSENKETIPSMDQSTISYFALGYDVTFKEYRGSMVMSASSHLWKYAGTLSDDSTKMTLDCEGPSMTEEAGTALYRDVIELIDENHRIMTSYAQDKDGKWEEFVKAHYFRI